MKEQLKALLQKYTKKTGKIIGAYYVIWRWQLHFKLC